MLAVLPDAREPPEAFIEIDTNEGRTEAGSVIVSLPETEADVGVPSPSTSSSVSSLKNTDDPPTSTLMFTVDMSKNPPEVEAETS